MRESPVPANEEIRLNAVRNGFCAYAPREERFDRITRTARRLLNVPIAVISIIEQNWPTRRAIFRFVAMWWPEILRCAFTIPGPTPIFWTPRW